MKNKRFLIILSIVMAVFLLSSCEKNKSEESKDEGQKVEENVKAEDTKKESETSEASFSMPKVAAVNDFYSTGMLKAFDENRENLKFINSFDDIKSAISSKEIDMALIPAEWAALLYNQGVEIKAVGIGSLGNMSIISHDGNIKFIPDLKGMKVVSLNTPSTKHVFDYILKRNELSEDNVKVEYVEDIDKVFNSANEENTVLLLQEPYASDLLARDKTLIENINLDIEYKKASQGTSPVTSVLVVRGEYLGENKDYVDKFLQMYKESVDYINQNPADGAKLADEFQLPHYEAAENSIPKSNLTLVTGMDMERTLKAFLNVISRENPDYVGGKVPETEFYYTNK